MVTIRLNLLVLKTRQLDRLKEFYSALGIEFAGENCKRSGLFLGTHGMALNLLLCRGLACHPLCGSWVGDEVGRHWR
jgi:hypothetical protein